MDTFAALMLSSHLPESDTQILQKTKPFKKEKGTLFDHKMVVKILGQVLY